MSFQEQLVGFIIGSADFICQLCIIAYVLYTFKIIGPVRMKNEVPSTLNDTWKNTGSFIANAADIANKLKTAINTPEGEENTNKTK